MEGDIIMTIVFDYLEEAQRVEKALREAFGPNAAIRTEEGWHGRVHVKIVSSEFDGKSEAAKQDIVWAALKEKLQEDAQAVSLVLAYGLDEI